MGLRLGFVSLVIAGLVSAQNPARTFGPWRLGMSREEVAAVKEHGPYQAVRVTGGIETRNGVFEGEKRNVAFVFDGDGALNKIQIWAYEGTSEKDALKQWNRVYRYYAKAHETVESAALGLPPAVDEAEFLRRSKEALASVPGHPPVKLQMAPRPMPAEAKVFASFLRAGGIYVIFVNVMEP